MFLETVGPVSSPRPDAASPSCIGGENASPEWYSHRDLFFSNATIEHVAYELYSVRLAAQFAGRGFVQLGIADSVDDRHWG